MMTTMSKFAEGTDTDHPIEKVQARQMGFPNMKYLDPETQGAPLVEKTFYKEYKENKHNDIK